MSYYITKFALTTGILEVPDSEVEETRQANMISVKGRFCQYFHGEGKEWHRTKGAAIARADEMRQNKIASLKKSLAKMEKISFCEQTIQ